MNNQKILEIRSKIHSLENEIEILIIESNKEILKYFIKNPDLLISKIFENKYFEEAYFKVNKILNSQHNKLSVGIYISVDKYFGITNDCEVDCNMFLKMDDDFNSMTHPLLKDSDKIKELSEIFEKINNLKEIYKEESLFDLENY
jgi:hypothetical protein